MDIRPGVLIGKCRKGHPVVSRLCVWVGSRSFWFGAIIVIMFCGIAVRAIARFLRSKWAGLDVAVVDCALRHTLTVTGGQHGSRFWALIT
ncbi:MAG: hypothetical protein C5S49_05085 [Candidatus Methanogaster sp.]|nr:MAG: hypothetical protein C5S49_05085 [ANME-2 cluster archaeon]